MASFDHLQQILGTNNKNKVFSVHQHSETGDLHVYFGLELFEVVPDDRDDVRFKLTVARLCNAGATYAQLERAFTVDPRITKRWSEALKSGDAEKLNRALAGVNAGRKLTKPIEEYVRVRFPYIYADDRYTYSSKIRKEIKSAFDVDLSSETLRPLLKELKNKFNLQDGEDENNIAQDEAGSGSGNEPETGSSGSDEGPDDLDVSAEGPGDREEPGDTESDQNGHSGAVTTADKSMPDNRKYLADFSTPQWSAHLGLLIFNQSLLSLQRSLDQNHASAVCQWASHVLLGAANLEQTKLHSRSDLGDLWGAPSLGSPSRQRQKLSELALDPELAENVLRWNFKQLGGHGLSDFYFDPHTKHYTGKQNVLKGWCSKIRWADKILNSDYIHTTDGAPVYLENTDNYDDMRARFKGLEERFRDCFTIDKTRKLTWTIDRGIFSREIFEWIANQPATHLITWEKGYKKDAWPEGTKAVGSFSVERARNHSQDLKTYRFEWIEEPWPANPEMRRIIVRAFNPAGSQIEVSIICSDPQRPAKEVIWLIFDRWVQENDFKYMDTHFGINQITSYQSKTYAEIRGEVTDRMVKNAACTALETARRDERNKIGKLLYQNREAQKKIDLRTGAISALQSVVNPTVEQKKELGSLRGAQQSAKRHLDGRDLKIKACETQIEHLDQQLESHDKEISRLDTLIEKGAVRLTGDRKYLMDVIKVAARNIFYKALAPFKEKYDNYRDDHVWYRHLTQSPGLIEKNGEGELKCQLINSADYPRQVRSVIEKLLKELNGAGLRLFDKSNRKIELILGNKSAVGNAISITGFEG